MEITITPYNIELQPTDINITIFTSGCTSSGDTGVTSHPDLTGKNAEVDVQHLTAAEKVSYAAKQDALVSGTNIKTVNSTSLLGSGNIEITSGSSDTPQVLPFSASITPVLANGNIMTLETTNDCTINVPSDMTAGQLFKYNLDQDSSGGHVVTWASGYRFQGNVTPIRTGTANSRDTVVFRAISTTEAVMETYNYDV